MVRSCAVALALVLSACASTAPPPPPPPAPPPPAPAAPPVAQGPNVRLPLMPAAIDLEHVPVGSWAEYAFGLDALGMQERVALVARGPEGFTIESSHGKTAGERVVHASTYAAGGEFRGESRRNVFQLGDDEPMEAPSLIARRYGRVDPSKLVGTETVTVRAGTFTAQHYRDRTAYDEQVDFWIDGAVMPFGLVKLEAEQRQSVAAGDRFKAELVGNGTDAVPAITKPARAFDVGYLKRRRAKG